MNAPWNMRFAVFFQDDRPIGEVLELIEQALGTKFEQDLEYKTYNRVRYTGYSLGLNASWSEEATWNGQKVYQLAGASDALCWFDNAELVDISFHVHALLSGIGLQRVMDFEEYTAKSKEFE